VARTKKRSSGKPAASARPDEAGDQPVDLSIDEILDGLEEVVQELEGGDLPLENALRRFEQGVALARKGSALLDAVEHRVEQLLAERDEAVPWDGEEKTVR